MLKGYFITSTDTGAGKTFIASALIRSLNASGLRTCGMKPIESGCRRQGDTLIPSDGLSLKQAAHMDEPLGLITPYCFESPLAPLPASEIEGVNIDIDVIKKAFYSLSGAYDSIIVEGVGGLLVPIKKDFFVADMARELGLPLLVVARPGLGTINHTLLTVNYALKAGLEVAGIIFNYSSRPENSLAEKTNPGILKETCPVPFLGAFPYLTNLDEEIFQNTALRFFSHNILSNVTGKT
jgi:dethiobiotin synthetase